MELLEKSLSQTVTVQSGTKNFSIIASQNLNITVTFPKAFNTIPKVLASVTTACELPSGYVTVVEISQINEGGFVVKVRATNWSSNNNQYKFILNWNATAPIISK